MIFSYRNLTELKNNLPDFNFLLCQIENKDWEEAIYIAKTKSKFTMDYNQNGIVRDEKIKFNNQLQGVLSEIAIEQYLTLLGFSVVRYDKIK